MRHVEMTAHNRRYEDGRESFSRKHLFYSDFTDEELAKYAFGLKRGFERTDGLNSVAKANVSLPREFDWRKRGIMTKAKYQGKCNACYSFVAVGLVEAHLKRTRNQSFDLSEQDGVDCTYERYDEANWGCEGGWPGLVLQYFNETGVVREKVYPYNPNDTDHGTCQPKTSLVDGIKGKLEFSGVNVTDEVELAQLLVTKGPLIVGVAADMGLASLKDGIFSNDTLITAEVNHVVILVGYGVDKGTNQSYWTVKNSWGTDWGRNGYGRIVRGKKMCNILDHTVWYIEPPKTETGGIIETKKDNRDFSSPKATRSKSEFEINE